MKVSLGIVHGKEVDGWFFHSILNFLSAQNPTEHTFGDHICVRSGPLLSSGRGTLLGTFLDQTDSDLMLGIDSDMVASPGLLWGLIDTFARAREVYPDLGMLAGVAMISGDPRCRNPKPNLWVQHPAAPDMLLAMQDFPPDTLMEVAATGASCFVLPRDVAEKFRGINPYHHISLLNWELLGQDLAEMDDAEKIAETVRRAVWDGDQLGEDVSFCARIRELGYKIMVHTGIVFDHSKSILLGHPEYLASRQPEAVLTGQEPQ